MATKILIALTSQRMIYARTAFSLVHALKKAKFDYDFRMELGCDIVAQRNRIVEAAKKDKVTHLLFIDYDMDFHPNCIQQLLDHKKDIVGAAYNKRQLPLESIAIPFSDITPTNELFRCQALGAGFLLIKMSVFDKLKEPYFMWGYDNKGLLRFGEDTYFCQMAIQAGFDVWADPNLKINHVGEYLY